MNKPSFECEDCIGMAEHGCYCAAMGAEQPGGPQTAPSHCPHCFESSGYVWEHGNDWNTGPWSNQTNIPCRYCNGTGLVDSEPATLDDLEQQQAEEPF